MFVIGHTVRLFMDFSIRADFRPVNLQFARGVSFGTLEQNCAETGLSLMTTKKEDRRIQRTRQLLQDALVELTLEKGYDKITVKDIIDHANVGRSTFYAHFQDKDDLLLVGVHGTRINQELSDHLADEHEAGVHDFQVVSILAIFRHAQQSHRLYKAGLGKQGADLIFKASHEYLCRAVETHLTEHFPDAQQRKVPLPILVDYVANSVLTLLRWWLDHDMPYSPEQMDEFFYHLVIPGVLKATGQAA